MRTPGRADEVKTLVMFAGHAADRTRKLVKLMDRLFPDPFSLADINSAHESRSRDSLLLLARLRFAGAEEPIDVRIRNLSAGGLMAEVATSFDRGTPVEVEVRGLGWVTGKIAWCAEGRTGIAFDQPIDPRRARKPVGGSAHGPVRAKGR